jgi:hypothetical protein
MFTLAADYLEKSWQHCPGVQRKYCWIFHFLSLEYFQLPRSLWLSLARNLPLNILEGTFGGKFKMEKEKILSG